MESYKSQQALIARRAKEMRIPDAELNLYFERKLAQVKDQYRGRSPGFILERTESLVWEHFFSPEPFPGKPLIKSERDDMKDAWIHDRFDPKATPFASRLDSYRPGGPAYKSLAAFIFEKAMEKGVPSEEYRRIQERYTAEVKTRYSDRSSDWRQWCEDDKTWKHFFPSKPFPGRQPDVDTPRIGTQGPSSAFSNKARAASREVWRETDRLEGGKISEPAPRYFSQAQHIEQQAFEFRIPEFELRQCFEEKEAISKARFGNESTEWRQFFIEASVWGHFFKSDRFPGIEPPRVSALPSRIAPSVVTSTGPRRPQSFLSSPAPAVASGPQNPSEALPVSPDHQYDNQERAMELKAIKLEIRSEFFRYLQKTRERIRAEHPSCTRQVRSYLADKHTWDHFFGKEQFPGIPPRLGHTPRCRAKDKAKDNSSLSPPGRSAPLIPSASSPVQKSMVTVPERASRRLRKSTNSIASLQNVPRGPRAQTNQALPANLTNILPERPQATVAVQSTSPVSLSWASSSILPKKQTSSDHTRGRASSMGLAGVTSKIGPSSLDEPVLPLESRVLPTQSAYPNSLQAPLTPILPTKSQPFASPNSDLPLLLETGTVQVAHLNSLQAKIDKIIEDAPKPVEMPALVNPPIKSRVPGDILAKLALIRHHNPKIPAGAIVMQNLEWTVSKSPTVKLMFDCSQSETIENAIKLGGDLKAELHFELSNGDLIMWSEPLLPGDVKSKLSANLFLKSWLERVLQFGIVQPSFYWKEMSNTMKFLSDDEALETEADIITETSDSLGGSLDGSNPLGSGDQTRAFADVYPQSQPNMDEGLLSAPVQSEERVKPEINMQLVVDPETGDEVTVEEFIKRIQIRCVGKPGTNTKRKISDDEGETTSGGGEPVSKRSCI